MKKFILTTLLFITIGLAYGQKKTIVGLAAETESLSTLVTAVKAADLVNILNGEGPFTVFAPTNAAFEALPDGVLEDLLKPENKDKLKRVLMYHVVPGAVKSTALKDGLVVETAQGESVEFDLSDGVKVNDADVVKADVMASNGVVHVIDAVILPPSMQ